ncbi:MAG: hypothetical protein OEQ53_13670 [Saprospiraceae bacterium]|nr:hypothetical protein [Saprospiraceae bacterium]
MIGVIIVLAIAVLLGWLLITPLEIRLDSINNQYLIRWRGIGNLKLIPTSDDLLLRLRVLFWHKEISPVQMMLIPKEKEKDKPKVDAEKKGRSKVKIQRWIKKGLHLLQSFHVKAMKLDLDTGDFIHNSYLYPIFHVLNRRDKQLNINFEGRTEILLIIQNRPYRIIAAWFF